MGINQEDNGQTKTTRCEVDFNVFLRTLDDTTINTKEEAITEINNFRKALGIEGDLISKFAFSMNVSFKYQSPQNTEPRTLSMESSVFCFKYDIAIQHMRLHAIEQGLIL
ncbi:hypothetical protein CDIK_1024 [Cucumispora dikerogammari]|nr:hypothetical protein CDIK_1024 [Cucumispora dikerogammari]